MIDWPLAFSTASQAIKLGKELVSVDKQLSQSELKLKIAELNTALADLKTTLTDAKNDSAEKDAEISRLKKLQQSVADETVDLSGYKYRKRTDGKEGGVGSHFAMYASKKMAC